MNEKEFLKKYDITQFERPSIAADIVLFTLDNSIQNAKKINVGPLQILLIRRASYPYKDKWALPGGFCRPDETIEETAERELFEETNVSNAYLENTKTFSQKGRDPRGWIISNAFIGAINKGECSLRADSDAWEAKWFNLHLIKEQENEDDTLYSLILNSQDEKDKIAAKVKCNKIIVKGRVKRNWSVARENNELGFDHALIIAELFYLLRKKICSDIRLLFEFVPETFTVGQLESAYKAIYNIEGRVPNFRRSIEKYIVETNEWKKETSYRPPKLYRKKIEVF